MARLQGKTAIITGGARGIGAACAELFVREGATIAVLDLNEAQGQELAARLSQDRHRARFCHCDVTQTASVDAAVARAVEALGAPTILVNNAGISVVGGLEELAEDQWDRQYAVNVKSIFLVSRRVIPLMRQAGGGSIINMGSESAFIGFPSHPAYTSSKAAVVHLSRSMAARYAPDKIRVNALCPGTIATEMYRAFLAQQPDPEAVAAEIVRQHPLGIGQAVDIAWAAVYLASDEARYTTGSAMLVDGGSTAI